MVSWVSRGLNRDWVRKVRMAEWPVRAATWMGVCCSPSRTLTSAAWIIHGLCNVLICVLGFNTFSISMVQIFR